MAFPAGAISPKRQDFRFFLISFLFILSSYSFVQFSYLFIANAIAMVLLTVVFFAFAMMHLSGIKFKRKPECLLGLFLAFIALFIYLIFAASFPGLTVYLIYGYVSNLVLYILLAGFLFLGLFFITTRFPKKARPYFVALGIILIIALLFIFYLSTTVVQRYKFDDEELLSYLSMKAFMQGLNPYALNFTTQMYTNSSNGPTITTNNQVVPTFDYPALFFLVELPFYILSGGSTAQFANFGMRSEAAAFILLLLVVIALVVKRENFRKPNYTLLVFVGMILVYIASLPTYIMLALLLLAYYKLDSKYSWVFLGLCLSIQEQLWLPALLLVAYSANNYGIKKGVTDAIGSAAVFLAINSYFIISNPIAFFKAITFPISQYLFVSPTSTIGYLLVTLFQLPLNVFGMIFLIGVATSLLIYLYCNDKRLLGILSLMPLMLLPHGISPYLVFFIAFTVIVMHSEKPKIQEHVLVKRDRDFRKFAAFAALLFAALILLIITSHNQFAQNFGVHAYAASLTAHNATNESVLQYSLFVNSSLPNASAVLIGMTGPTMFSYGIFNASLFQNTTKCAPIDYQCLVNVNKIPTNKNITINATIPNFFNKSADFATLMLYNGKYIAILPPAHR